LRISCGIDTIRISRIKDAYNRKGERFLERIYTPVEQADCESKGKGRMPSLATRFAAKEAVSKALGTGIGAQGVRFSDIEVVMQQNGRPTLVLYGKTQELFLRLGGRQAEISLSHDGDQAMAVCVMYFEEHTKTGGAE
jgi:holo-[acyl-carrier protein] synthase